LQKQYRDEKRLHDPIAIGLLHELERGEMRRDAAERGQVDGKMAEDEKREQKPRGAMESADHAQIPPDG
jgi:hypothetical protein